MLVKSYICANWSPWDKSWNYRVLSYDASTSDPEYILIEARELEFESLSDRELKREFVAALRKKKSKVRADAQVELNSIDEQIQELLAIEDRSESGSDEVPL